MRTHISNEVLLAQKATYNKVKINKLVNFNVKPINDIKVSVLVPVCNVQEYLRECLDSIINQTLKDIEIICINDGSTDSCEAILEEYADNDTRVKIIDKTNAGYGHAMNIGFDMSKGKYIGIVESDDFVDAHMYEDLYNIAITNDLDFVKSNFNRFVRENGELKLFYNNIVPKPYQNRVLVPRKETQVFRGVLNTWTGIYSREFLLKYNIRHNETPGASYQDNGFFFQTFMFADRAYFSDKAYYMNRRDNPNSSVYSNSKMFCMKQEYEYIRNIMAKNPKFSKGLLPIYWVKKFHNYLFTCDRLDNENLKIFLETFYSEFRQALDSGEVDFSAFSDDEYEKLSFLMNNKEGYYEAVKHSLLRISVIIPIFNEEANLRKCLDSVFGQTLKDIQIICIDDGSTDKSLDIINEYKAKHDNIKLIKQKNCGAGVARNKGLEIAEGEFICFMDADDWYPSTTILKNLYIAAKNHNVDICGGSFSTFSGNKVKTTYENEYSDYTFTKNQLINYSDYQFDYGYHRFIYNNAFLRQNEIKFPPYKRYQDPPFFVKAMVTAGKFYAIKQVVYCYRKNNAKLVWTKEKLIDMLNGIKDNLIVAKNEHLAKLYYLNIGRINKDYLSIILQFVVPENKDVLLKLFEIQSLIDEQLISEALHGKVEQFIIKPLWRAIFNSGNASVNVKDESKTVSTIELQKIYDVVEQIQISVDKLTDKENIFKRGIKYIKKFGLKCMFIRIFKGQEAANNYLKRKEIQNNSK